MKLPGMLGATLFEAPGLAQLLAQEVELGTADLAVTQHFQLVDGGAVQGEDALHAHAARHFADGEGGAHAAALDADDDALEELDALFLAFLHFDVHLDGVARLDAREVRAEKARFELIDDVAHVGSWASGPNPDHRRTWLESPRTGSQSVYRNGREREGVIRGDSPSIPWVSADPNPPDAPPAGRTTGPGGPDRLPA